MMDFCKEPYSAIIDKPIILPSPSEQIWEKFEYFDKKTEEYPNDDQYVDIKDELLGLWFEQFKKELEFQVPIFKKESEK